MAFLGTPFVLALVAAATAAPPDFKDVGTPKKEPAYRTKHPRYALLAFGPEAKDRVWLVHDGDALYVDRDGDGDLTRPANKVAAETAPGGADDGPYKFKAGELRVGGRVHKGLEVRADRLSGSSNATQSRPNAKAALAADRGARAYSLVLDVKWPGLTGKGVGGRVMQLAGDTDLDGVLLFAERPADAPVIHFGGPLRVTFFDALPALKLNRDNNVYLVVGTPGRGPGTFATLVCETTIPAAVMPVVEAVFPAARAGDPPVRERYELKERC